MKLELNSIRTFIGSKDFDISRAFYRDLGFEETTISDNLSVFKIGECAFYLQKAYVKDWVDNTMIFLEVPDVNKCFEHLQQLELDRKYPGTQLRPIRKDSWGAECFVIDPAGVLIHFGEFY